MALKKYHDVKMYVILTSMKNQLLKLLQHTERASPLLPMRMKGGKCAFVYSDNAHYMHSAMLKKRCACKHDLID